MKLRFIGAAGTVTGSATLLEAGGTKILVDCGLVQGDDDAHELNHQPLPLDLDALDAVVLTHGHLDHCGRLPWLVAQGYSGPVFAQAATVEIAEIVLRDAARLGSHREDPLYDERHVDATMNLMRPLRYRSPERVGSVEFELFDAGHILGSSHVAFESAGKRVVFSGDVGMPDTPIIRDPTLEWPWPVDAVVIESTYGDRSHRSREETEQQFCDIVRNAVEHRGVVLIPSFAIGRTQEMLYQFNHLVDSGRIERVPVFLDSPMAERVTEIYRRHRELYDRETLDAIARGDPPMRFPGLRELVSAEQSKQVKSIPGPLVVIAGSGMCTGGRILHHLIDFLPKPSTTVIFVGWQGPGTLGRRLIDGAKSVKIYGEEVDVAARIETLGGFSAHADAPVLLRWAEAFGNPGPRFFVNHGEPPASAALAAKLASVGYDATAVEHGLEAEV
ncbi:MAG: MBL fold metallo-hydrolase [Deltaproteobacteria bacterium]|nr:MAG: MBL fold metallo-hydrolase [Deltaproteobacteria bacterium]